MKRAPTSTTPALPPFVDLETAARLAGVTRRTVQNKLASREIPHKAVKLEGRQKFVSTEALQAAFGRLRPLAEASLPQGEAGDEAHGRLHGNFHEGDADEVRTLQQRIAALEAVNTHLQQTLDHERQDRANEREHWRASLDKMQANLLAAQDTPTARALAGGRTVTADTVTDTSPPEPMPSPARPKKHTRSAPKAKDGWWSRLFS